jgi:predicted homoserine dehydrogenase-like protein
MLLPVLKERHRRGEILKVSLVGAGQMGEGLVAQMETMYGMRGFVVADVVPGRAVAVLRSAGVDEADIVETDDVEVASNAIEANRRVASTNPSVAWADGVDVTVEATGIPEVGARVAYEAILARKHVVQMNVETDATVGWLLRRMANAAGVVYTLTAGDEPGSTMELFDFAVSLGFEVVAAGKGKNNPLDRTGNPDTVAEKAAAQQMHAPQFRRLTPCAPVHEVTPVRSGLFGHALLEHPLGSCRDLLAGGGALIGRRLGGAGSGLCRAHLPLQRPHPAVEAGDLVR